MESETKVSKGYQRGPILRSMERTASDKRAEERRAGRPLTYGRHHGAHEVEGSGEVPARAQGVGTDPGGQCGLVVPEEGAQLRLRHAVRRAEVAQRGAPARPRLRLAGALER